MNTSKLSTATQIVSVLFILLVMALAKAIVLPVLIAIFISIICMQPIIFLAERKTPYGLAVILVFLAALIVLFILGMIVASSFSMLLADIPKYQDNIIRLIDELFANLGQFGLSIDDAQLSEFINTQKILSAVSDVFSNIGLIIADTALVFLITIFLLLEAPTFVNKTAIVERYSGTSIQHLEKVGRVVRHYLSIKTFISFLTGLLIWMCLFLIGVDYPILWGVIAFLLNYIPNVGSIIAAVPTMLLALIQLGPGGMVWTAIAYVAVNFIIGNIVEPRVLGKGLGLSTLVILLSLIFWGFILGPLGMILSVPLTMTIKIILENNSRTNWIAVLLGTGQEATSHVENLDSPHTGINHRR